MTMETQDLFHRPTLEELHEHFDLTPEAISQSVTYWILEPDCMDAYDRKHARPGDLVVIGLPVEWSEHSRCIHFTKMSQHLERFVIYFRSKMAPLPEAWEPMRTLGLEEFDDPDFVDTEVHEDGTFFAYFTTRKDAWLDHPAFLSCGRRKGYWGYHLDPSSLSKEEAEPPEIQWSPPVLPLSEYIRETENYVHFMPARECVSGVPDTAIAGVRRFAQIHSKSDPHWIASVETPYGAVVDLFDLQEDSE